MWTVEDIMTKTVFTIRSSATVQQAIALMQEKQVRSLIVEREVASGEYGIVSASDIVCKVTALSADPLAMRVGEIMRQPLTVLPELSLPAVARKMRDNGVQQVLVVEEKQFVGVVSAIDIVMKSDVSPVDLPEDFAEQVGTALRHKRLHWDETFEVERESAIARAVLTELDAK